MTIVFDASPLITACKFDSQGKLVVDHLLSGCCIVISSSVEEEVAVLGAGYPDGVVAGERIVQGVIHVEPVTARKWVRHLADYVLGDGEKDSIELCGQVEEVEALVRTTTWLLWLPRDWGWRYGCCLIWCSNWPSVGV